MKRLHIIPLIFAALLIVTDSCTDPAEPEGIRTGTQTNNTYTAPSYPDDYSSIASWDHHSRWNLANVHDPSIAFYDGYYYMYCTDASYGNEHLKASRGRHFQGRRSKDLVNWTYVQGVMDHAPSWVGDSLNSIRTRMGLDPIPADQIRYGYWAPVVRSVTVNGEQLLRMYYCIVVDNYIKSGLPTTAPFDGSWSERAFIGVCQSRDPAGGEWEDLGFVTCSSSDRGPNGWSRPSQSNWEGYFYYNAIDPTYIETPQGRHWLIYGSWHSGFALLEIDPVSGKPVAAPLGNPWADDAQELMARYGLRIGTRNATSRWQGSEAPEIIYKDGYYYLFMAYDALNVPYNTRVVRSKNIEGPYLDITGRNFTNGRGDCYPIVTHPYKFNEGFGWTGISHCAIFQRDGSNEWFYCSQGRLPHNVGGNPYSNAIMMGHVRRLVWCPASPSEPDNLWPIALPERYAAVPQSPIAASEIAGTWEHINLDYNYGVQDGSTDLVLHADGTMSGAMSGRWSFDDSTRRLTLGDVVVCVERELDWEATPRRATLVYAGCSKNRKTTYYGKKIIY